MLSPLREYIVPGGLENRGGGGGWIVAAGSELGLELEVSERKLWEEVRASIPPVCKMGILAVGASQLKDEDYESR